jgi:hypothetical protein
MKKIYAVIILVCVTVTIKAQSFQDHFFSSYGIGLDFGAGPGQVYCPVYSSSMYDSACFAYQNSYVGISVAFEPRFNLFEPSADMAVSLKAKPTLNILFGAGILGIYIPIGIGLEVGNGSTYQSESNMGLTFTAGYSLNFNPLIREGDFFDMARFYQVDLKTNWGSPFIAAGVRYWTGQNKLREVNVLYGFGGGSNDELPATADYYGIESNLDDGKNFKKSFMLCISYTIYMNY